MSNTCVCCGREVPEGRQVCPICENSYSVPDIILADGSPLFLRTQIKYPHTNLQLFLYDLLNRRKK